MRTPDYKNLIFTNAIINGGFDYWQRGGISAAVNTTTSFAYAAADRWLHRHTGTFTGTPNVQRDTDSPSNNFSTYALRHRFRRNASTALLEHQQRIESVFSKQLLSRGPVSVSFWVKSTLSTGSVRFRLRFATASDNHATQTQFYDSGLITVPTAGVWQHVKKEAIALPAEAVNGIALVIQYDLPSGTDASDQDFEVTQVSLTSGVQVQDFEPAGGDLATELMLCQRYFEKSYNLETVPNVDQGAGVANWFGACMYLVNSGGAGSHSFILQTSKRIAPTITLYNPRSGVGTARIAGDTANIAISSLAIGTNIFTASISGGTASSNYVFHYTADAEIN